jgi:hypothetical protein
MEWWNNGFKIKKFFLFKYESQVIMYLVDLNLLNPSFQYSAKASLRAQYSNIQNNFTEWTEIAPKTNLSTMK